MTERPVSDVPRCVLGALLLALLLHIGLRATEGSPLVRAFDLGSAPSEASLRLAAFGDPTPLAKLMMLYLQSFDSRAENMIRYREMNYGELTNWLARILSLDPSGQYPLHMASRVYAEVPDTDRQRTMLEFIYRRFFADPERRWPWLAHATHIAKHELRDLPLARRYAAAIQKHVHNPALPLWARQMEAFILEDMNELEAARIMFGGFIAGGQIKEPGEMRLIEDKLKQIEAKLKAQARR